MNSGLYVQQHLPGKSNVLTLPPVLEPRAVTARLRVFQDDSILVALATFYLHGDYVLYILLHHPVILLYEVEASAACREAYRRFEHLDVCSALLNVAMHILPGIIQDIRVIRSRPICGFLN